MRICHFTITLVIGLLSVSKLGAYEKRDLLQHQRTVQELQSLLVANQEWVKYPLYTDREGWNAFLGTHKTHYIQRGEARLNHQWQVVKATDYLAFERTGERVVMENPFNANNTAIVDLLLAELAEGEGRFIDQLINGVFHTCEMTSWVLSAHLVKQSSGRSLPTVEDQVVDLMSGDISSLLAWVYYFLHDSFDKIDPEISKRVRNEIQRRTLEPYMKNEYWWSALNYTGQMVNNWNPWCNSNVLQCFMLLENDKGKLAAGIYRTMQSVDQFINYTHSDGACEEGPSYWGHAAGKLLDYLELLYTVTDGKISLFDEKIIRNMGEYISRSYVGNGWVVNFADASAKSESNHPHLIYRFGKHVNSDELKGFAALKNDHPHTPNNGRDLYRTLTALDVDKALNATQACHSHQLLTWYPETEFCYISTGDLFFAAKGGYNDESHNHNDIGTCSVWMNSTPVLIDAGVGTYTRQTFSSERYTIWTMQSDYHNLPRINGISQKYGKQYRATDVVAGKNGFKLNIAKAYPETAKVEKWIRSYRVKGKEVTIDDEFSLSETVAPNEINFMTGGTVDEQRVGEITIKTDAVTATLHYDPAGFDSQVEPVVLTDVRLSKVWGKQIYRISFKAKQQLLKGRYRFNLKQQ